MLYIIGMGLDSYKDLSLRSIEILQNSSKIYFENYTSVQQSPITELKKYLNKEIIICDRNMIESSDIFFENALLIDICVLVAGTPMFATTHIELVIRGKQLNINVEIIHNASILNVYGCLGLYSYHFGKTVSIPFFTDTWKPTSFLTNIKNNIIAGLHTLCLLDIKVDEERYMTANQAITQILECEGLASNYKIFVICRFGSIDQLIKFGTIQNLQREDFGKPLHSIVIPAQMDRLESELVEQVFN